MFRRFFTTLLASIFMLFLISSHVTLGNVGSDITIVSAGIADTCTWNISCEKISKTEYACHSSGEFISTSAKIIREIPAGKYGADTIAKKSSFREESVGYDREKWISYVGPDTYVYPFVRVTKIQV